MANLSLFCLVVAFCVCGSAGFPRAKEEMKPETETTGMALEDQRIIQRLLRLPIGVLKILLDEQEKRIGKVSGKVGSLESESSSEESASSEESKESSEGTGASSSTTEKSGGSSSSGTERESSGEMSGTAGPEEGEWEELDLVGGPPQVVKSLLEVPKRCKVNEGLVGGKCRKAFE